MNESIGSHEDRPAPRPRSIPEIEEQLLDLRGCLTRMEEYGAHDLASRLSLESARVEESELQDELLAARLVASEDDADVSLTGGSVFGHFVDGAFFGQLLLRAQQLVNAIAQSLGGQVAQMGRFRESLVEDNRFLLTQIYPGSFGFRLRTTTSNDLLNPSHEGLPSLEIVRSLLSPGEAGQDVAREYCSASPRIASHYKELLDLLTRQQANLAITTRGDSRRMRFSAQDAAQRRAWLLNIYQTEVQREIRGVLVGTSLVKDRFELQVQEEVLRGKASRAACETISSLNLLGKLVLATVRESVENQADAAVEPVTKYFLVSISPVLASSGPSLWDASTPGG